MADDTIVSIRRRVVHIVVERHTAGGVVVTCKYNDREIPPHSVRFWVGEHRPNVEAMAMVWDVAGAMVDTALADVGCPQLTLF